MQLAHTRYFQLLCCRIVCEYSATEFGSKSKVIIDFIFRRKIKSDRLFSDLHFYVINSNIYHYRNQDSLYRQIGRKKKSVFLDKLGPMTFENK